MSHIIPSLFVKNQGDRSVKIALRLTTARNRVVVRLTGGCGYMSAEDARDFLSLFADADRKNQGDRSVKIALRLTTARNRVVVRLTGGCGYMSAEDARDFLSLFADAFAG